MKLSKIKLKFKNLLKFLIIRIFLKLIKIEPVIRRQGNLKEFHNKK